MTATFADTNILVYAATPLTAPSRAKSEIARVVLAENEIVISTQVLQEFYWAATRPHKLNLTHTDAVGWLDIFKRFPVQPITLSVVEDALFLCASYQLSSVSAYFDANQKYYLERLLDYLSMTHCLLRRADNARSPEPRYCYRTTAGR
jgi:predicted nucleic acid-binding protein